MSAHEHHHYGHDRGHGRHPPAGGPGSVDAPAAVIRDRCEPDGTAEQATRIDWNSIHEATLAPAGDVDWLLFRTDAPTTDVHITARGQDGYLYPSLQTAASLQSRFRLHWPAGAAATLGSSKTVGPEHLAAF